MTEQRPMTDDERRAKAKELRERAARMRQYSQYADSGQARARDLDEASRLEGQAAALERQVHDRTPTENGGV